jgi:hypothetical protein
MGCGPSAPGPEKGKSTAPNAAPKKAAIATKSAPATAAKGQNSKEASGKTGSGKSTSGKSTSGKSTSPPVLGFDKLIAVLKIKKFLRKVIAEKHAREALAFQVRLNPKVQQLVS